MWHDTERSTTSGTDQADEGEEGAGADDRQQQQQEGSDTVASIEVASHTSVS
jgi:hypothetical protein